MSGVDPSVRGEPQFQGGPREGDPSERKVALRSEPQDALQADRASVRHEPWMEDGGSRAAAAEHFARMREGTTRAGDLGLTALVALLAGPAAVVGCFLVAQGGVFGVLYLVALGPVLEEILKQSGSIWLLEKRPWRIFSPWQFVLAGVTAGLVFGVLENILYFEVYRIARDPTTVAIRWYGCTSLHVVCSLLASVGLRRTWRRLLGNGGPVDLAPAYPWFAAAMVLHGAWNAVAVAYSLVSLK